MGHYTEQGNYYVADVGYQFVNKTDGMSGTIIFKKDIDKFDCVEIPPEPEKEPFDYEAGYNELIQEVLGDEQ